MTVESYEKAPVMSAFVVVAIMVATDTETRCLFTVFAVMSNLQKGESP